MSEERFLAIETKIDALDTRLSGVDSRLSGQIEALDNRLSGQITALGNQMRVLHEDTIANIKALASDFAPIRREFQDADAKLKEDLDQRLTPLEAFARRQRGE